MLGNNQEEKANSTEEKTFSVFLFTLLLLTVDFYSLIIYTVAVLTSDPYLSTVTRLEIWILTITLLLILGIATLFSLLPYKPIDYSHQALKKSFLHKLLFLCTSPILLIGFFIAEYINTIYLSNFQDLGLMQVYLIWSVVHIVTMPVWIEVTLKMWEKFYGIDASQTLKFRRKKFATDVKTQFDPYLQSKESINVLLKNSNHKSHFNTNEPNKQPATSSSEWFIFCSLPSMLITLVTMISTNFTTLFFGFGLGLELIAIFGLFIYDSFFVKTNHTIKFLEYIRIPLNEKHGLTDVSETGFMIILFAFMGNPICIVLYMFFQNNIIYQILFLIGYILIILFIVLRIWSLQEIKKFFHL